MSEYDKYLPPVEPNSPAVSSATPEAINYDKYIDGPQASELDNSLDSARGVKPEQKAKELDLAKKLNMPVAILPADAADLVMRRFIDTDKIIKENPATNKFLTDKDNAQVTGLDGVSGLQRVEETFRKFPLDEQIRAKRDSYTPENIIRYIKENSATSAGPAMAAQKLTELKNQGYDLNEVLAGNVKEPSPLDFTLTDEVGAMNATDQREVDRILMREGMAQREENPYLSKVKDVGDSLMTGAGRAVGGAIRGADTTLPEGLVEQKAQFWIDRANEIDEEAMKMGGDKFLREVGGSTGYSLATLLPMVTLGPIGVPTAFGMMYRGAENNFVNDLRGAYEEANGKVSDEDWTVLQNTMDSEIRASALWEAVPEVISDKIFLGLLRKTFGKDIVGSLTKRIITNFGLNVTQETMSEMVTQMGQTNANASAFEKLGIEGGPSARDWASAADWVTSFKEVAPTVAAQTLLLGGLGGAVIKGKDFTRKQVAKTQFFKGVQTRNAQLQIKTHDNALRAEAAFSNLDQLVAESTESKLRQRSPSAFRDFVATMVEEDSPLEAVYADATQLLEDLGELEVGVEGTPTSFPAELYASIKEAQTTGSLVRIETPDFLAHVAGLPTADKVLENLMVDPEGATYKESQEFFQQAQDSFTEQVDTLTTENADVMSREEFQAAKETETATPTEGTAPTETKTTEKLPDTYEEYTKQHANKKAVYEQEVATVEDKILTQFTQANQFTSSVNRTNTAPLVEFYKTQAGRMGISPMELYNKFPFKVRSFLQGTAAANELGQSQPAVLDDFRAENLSSLLEKDSWVIMTAENPKAVYTPEKNPELMASFEAELKAQGVEYYLVDGQYGNKEKSAILFNVTPEQALALGRKYDQDSVLTRDGFVYQDGSRHRATGSIDIHETAPEDYYTTVTFPDGTTSMFTVDIDFDTKIETGQMSPIPVEKVGSLEAKDTKPYRYFTYDEIAKLQREAFRELEKTEEFKVAVRKIDTAFKEESEHHLKVIGEAIRIFKEKVAGNSAFDDIIQDKTALKNIAINAFYEQAKNIIGEVPNPYLAVQEKNTLIDQYFIDKGIPKPSPFSESTNQKRDYYSTPNFVNWFKDSKVVDSQGNPLVAVHVTEFDFDTFNPNIKEGSVDTHAWYTGQVGSWFTAPSFYGLNYEQGNAETAVSHFVDEKTGANTMLVHLSIQNPMEYEGFEDLTEDRDSFKSIKDWKQHLINAGHDGIVVRNSETDGNVDRDDWVAFEPNQIKSAIGNVGTFDANNPNILLQSGKVGEVTVVGTHFSPQQLNIINGARYGTGLKGAERDRVFGASDRRLKSRVHFYVDEGKGVFPEWGVGDKKHIVTLPNMYDGARNPLKFSTKNEYGVPDFNAFESAVIDAGFDGYYIEKGFGRQGTAVLLGDAARSVRVDTKKEFAQAETFYSQLSRAISGAKQKAMPANQWVAWLNGNAPKLGIKKEEIEWTGINEWLELQEGKVTKEQIAEYLDGNGVQVEDVVLGAYKGIKQEDENLLAELEGRAPETVLYDYDAGANQTKYPTYVVGGEGTGENYKELLLTLPEKEIARPRMEVFQTLRGYQVIFEETQNFVGSEVSADGFQDAIRIAWDRYKRDNPTEMGIFRSNHFDQKNILAHVRMDERMDDEGNVVLFINEIQSDWGQEGKKRGFIERYRSEDVKPLPSTDVQASQPELFWYFEVPNNVLQIPKSRYATEAEALSYILNEKQTISGATTPKAPFVTNTKAWTSLAVKRLLRYAVDNGIDKVAFINGEQAADLYDLSKQVDELTVVRHEDDTFTINADLPNGRTHLVGERIQKDKLPDLIGKDLAKTVSEQHIGGDVYNGNQLKVGGEGMKAFYDGIIPQVVNDVLKKIGGTISNVNLFEFDKNQDTYYITLPNGKVVHTTPFLANAEANLQFFPDAKIEKYTGEITQQVGVTITPEMRETILQGLPLFQQSRGSFNVDTLTTTLFSGANLSTVLHESGHFYLKMLENLGTQQDAPADIQKDFETVMDWFGLTTSQWVNMSIDEQRPYHEQWAESFELWNLEGKAPSHQLQGAFSRFRAWLLSVYKSAEEFLRQHPDAGKLNDEIRDVFGRLLASQETIEATVKDRQFQAIYKTSEEAGVSQKTFDEYTRLGETATQDAVDELQNRSMRDMKWLSGARNRAIKALQAQAKEERLQIMKEVTAEVMAEPINKARKYLKTGEIVDPITGDLIKLTEGFKLDRNILAAMFPETALDTPELSKLRGLTSDKGLHPDLVAKMFDISSGDALVRELIDGENANEKIIGITEQRMLEEYGELIDERSIQRAADEAVHNSARAKFVATGLKMLTKSSIPVSQLVKAAKTTAERIIASKKVRDIKPKSYLAAETRANKKVLQAVAKDPAGAVEAQRASLLNNRLATVAQDALSEVEKALKYLSKFNNEGTRKNLDLDYLEQIDALLEPFDLRKGLSLTTIDSRTSLVDWIAQQEALGYEPTIDPEAVAEARQKSYKNMTMTEVRGLVDTIKQIEHMGRMIKKLLTAQERAEFRERIEEAKLSIAENAGKTVKEHETPSDVVGTLARWGRQMAAGHRKFASFMRELDGGKDNGVMLNLLALPAARAANAETELRQEATDAIAKLFQPIIKSVSKSYIVGNIYASKKLVPNTDISMTHEQRIMFAMNWGNEGNRQRLMDGGLTGVNALSPQQAGAILDTITKEEWDFIQGVWDYLETYKPMVEEQERLLTGKTPEWVDPAPVVTKYGTYRGGYYPAKYDRMLSSRSDTLEAASDLRLAMKGAYGTASARNGYTKARADAVVGRPILLSFNTLQTHVNEVIHRLTWQSWLIDSGRIVRALDADLRKHLGAEALASIKKLREDIATGEARSSTPVEAGLNHIRVGTTIVGLGYRLSTALLQPIGITNSMARIGTKYAARGVAQYIANPLETAKWVVDNSLFMKNRATTMNRNINEILNTVRVGEKYPAIKGSFFYLIGKLQRIVDIPTYLGGYEKALEQMQYENATSEAERKQIEKKAHELAEQAVKDSQGGGEMQDLAEVQRGSPALKLFTNFYSYMNMVYNLNVNAFRGTNFKNPTEIGIFAADMVLINFLPAVLSVLLRNALKGECAVDDLECLAGKYKSEQISYLTGQLVGVRELSSAVDAATGGEVYGYSGPAGVRFFADMQKLGTQINQGEVDSTLLKTANNVGGVLFHYPAGQINNTLEGIAAINAGEVEGWGMLQALASGHREE